MNTHAAVPAPPAPPPHCQASSCPLQFYHLCCRALAHVCWTMPPSNANSRILGAKLLHFPTHISESYTAAHNSSTEWGSSGLSLDLEHFQECFLSRWRSCQVQHTNAEMQTNSRGILIVIRGSHVYADSCSLSAVIAHLLASGSFLRAPQP